jgi:hypothetical protein
MLAAGGSMRQHMIRWMPLVVVSLAVGCGPSVESVCREACNCSDECDDADLDECVAEGEELENAAEDAGCTEQFNDFLACVDDSLECVNGTVETDDCEEFLSSCEP